MAIIIMVFVPMISYDFICSKICKYAHEHEHETHAHSKEARHEMTEISLINTDPASRSNWNVQATRFGHIGALWGLYRGSIGENNLGSFCLFLIFIVFYGICGVYIIPKC